jgi:hypothetical protein
MGPQDPFPGIAWAPTTDPWGRPWGQNWIIHSVNPDLGHGPPEGAHWDYKIRRVFDGKVIDKRDRIYRYFPDGRWTEKRGSVNGRVGTGGAGSNQLGMARNPPFQRRVALENRANCPLRRILTRLHQWNAGNSHPNNVQKFGLKIRTGVRCAGRALPMKSPGGGGGVGGIAAIGTGLGAGAQAATYGLRWRKRVSAALLPAGDSDASDPEY